MPNPKPAPFNFTPNDPTGTTWALPEGAIVRLGKGYQNPTDTREMALSPDETCFAVGTRIGLWWYDVVSMTPIALWETERGLISIVEISPDGKLIALANCDAIIKVRDIQSGECVSQINQSEIHHTCGHISFSPDSCWLFIVSADSNVKVLDVQSGECIAQMEQETNDVHASQISKLRFSPDGQHVASTLSDQTYLWDPKTGVITAKFTGRNFAFSPDSRLMACQNPYKTPDSNPVRWTSDVSVWDIGTGERIAYIKDHQHLVNSIRFSPCKGYMVTSDRYGSLNIWNLTKGCLEKSVTDYEKSRVVPYYLADGTLLATVFKREIIEVWNIKQREKLQSYELPIESIGYRWFSKCPKLAIANSSSNRQTISKKTLTFPTLTEPICFPRPVKFTNEEELAVRGNIRDIILWDIKSGQTQTISYPTEYNEGIKSFTFLPTGDILVVDWNHNHNVYRVIKISESDAIPIAEFTPPIQLGNDTFTLLDERIAFSGKGGVIYFWDLKHSEIPRQFIGHTDHVWSLAFSPDGKSLVSGSGDKTVRIWNCETGEEVARLPLEKPITTRALAYSPCGSMIVGGMFGKIYLWCAEKMTITRVIPQPEDSHKLYTLGFSPCGRYLVSGTWWQEGMKKMAIRLWEVSTGANIHTFWGHTTDNEFLEFSSDGTILVSGSFDGTVLLWDVKPFIDV